MSTQVSRREGERAPVEFTVIELYERMLIQRTADPYSYQMQHSLAEKNAAEHYERAKRKAGAKR